MLLGRLDTVTNARVAGWAHDPDHPGRPVALTITVDGLVAGQVEAAPEAPHAFALPFDPPMTGGAHQVAAFRTADGTHLPASPHHLPGIRGQVDILTRDSIQGWAHHTGQPGEHLTLAITVDGAPVATLVANAYREDLAQNGIGDGRHAYAHDFSPPLSPLAHQVAVTTLPGSAIHGGIHVGLSPLTLETIRQFDQAMQSSIAAALDSADSDAAIRDRLAFLTRQTANLLQRRAERASNRAERLAAHAHRHRWIDPEAPPAPEPARRALIIDCTLPDPNRDAGSVAILSHAASLQRLGYQVVFIAADLSAHGADALARLGIAACHAPWFASVEELLRLQSHGFDLVYLHRVASALPYLALVRQHLPRARVVFSVADLHHVRIARQAVIEDRPELHPHAERLRRQELLAAAESDVTITHSGLEAAALRQAIPGLNVHTVPWAVEPSPAPTPFDERDGVAFIGHYGHAPNLDAALYLAEEVMPLVHATHPGIICHLVGTAMPEPLRRPRPGIVAHGAIGNLPAFLAGIRLTIAPLLFGAGIKGKVLDSLAAGIPCICTPVAAEGIALGPTLRSLVPPDGATPEQAAPALAAAIIRLHTDPALHAACRQEGLDYVATHLGTARIDALMRAALP